jgi:hypothetical protein
MNSSLLSDSPLRMPPDLVFYVMGSAEENELLLMGALSCLVQALDTILRRNLGKYC